MFLMSHSDSKPPVPEFGGMTFFMSKSRSNDTMQQLGGYDADGKIKQMYTRKMQ